MLFVPSLPCNLYALWKERISPHLKTFPNCTVLPQIFNIVL